jgi:hypothetical protein
MNVSTREQWIDFAGGPDEAAKYESLFVQAEPTTLPPGVRSVIERRDAEPGPDYWAYLASQWLDHMWPPSPRLHGTPVPPLKMVKPRGLLARLGIQLLRRPRR